MSASDTALDGATHARILHSPATHRPIQPRTTPA